MNKELHLYFQKIGRKGGKKYKKAHTPKERSEAARKAALARWSKKKTK